MIKIGFNLLFGSPPHMTTSDIPNSNFKEFNFAVFIADLGPKFDAVVNANCTFDYPDISNTYKKILSDINVENTNYNNFRKALLNFFKEREASYCTLTYIQTKDNKVSYIPPSKPTILYNYYVPFLLQFGFFPGVTEELLQDTIKHLYVSSIAHGCRFLSENTDEDLLLDVVQFEAFANYETYLPQVDYYKIEPIVTNKNWYKFLECKLQFDTCFEKFKHTIEQYIITDPELMETRKKIIFDVLNQNGEVNVTNSYLESSMNSIQYNGISLFELSILQTLTVGCLKYIPNHGTSLIGEPDNIKHFNTMAKKRRPLAIIKKLAELAVLLGYNGVLFDPSDKDIVDIGEMMMSYCKNFNEIKHNLELYIYLVLEIGIANAKIDIKPPGIVPSINPKSLMIV